MPRKKGEGSYQKLPNGTFEFSVELGRDIYGKRQRKRFYGQTEAECRKKYKQFLKDGEPETVSQNLTLSVWVEKWLVTYKKGSVSEGTYSDYESLAAHVKSHKLGGLKLPQVKPINVTDFFADKKEYSYSFLKRMRFLINAAFEDAIDNELCDKNPVRRAVIPKKQQPPKEAFTEEETKTIVEFAKTDHLFGVAIYIMFNTGIRSQEMRALRLVSFDFANGIITIDRAVKRNGELGLPKNNKTRFIPIKPEAVDFIRDNLRCGRYIIGDMDYVSKEGFRSRYNCFFDRLNKHLLRKGKEPIVVKSPHATRHTYATLLQKRGMPIAMVSALLGHESTDVTDKYTHVNDVNILTHAVRQYDLFE